MFTNPFTKAQGFGDGDDAVPTGAQNERGTLQGNGTFQRIVGLDAQTCLECHSIVSRRTVPMKFGIGGVGGVNNTVLGAGGNTFVDLDLTGRSGGVKQQNINGRVINPPFIFGASGIELLANEMTAELQAQLAAGPTDGVTATALSSKGVSFGSVVKDANNPDGSINIITNDATGTFNLDPNSEEFMVVAPFGRKGNEKSTRTFDIGALSFHFGMGVNPLETNSDGTFTLNSYGQVIEITGTDHDGIRNEVTQGELSVLSAFVATAQTPHQKKLNASAKQGEILMNEFGCTSCHVPSMETTSTLLGLRFPEVANDPSQNVYVELDMTEKPMSFKKNKQGGITIPLFADLKRHYMGPSLEEFDGDGMYTTMRLWGVADTAPYLHDGRALTIRDAIVEHGTDASSDANAAVSAFITASAPNQAAILAFLNTLRSPNGTFKDLERLKKVVAGNQGVAAEK